MIQIQITIDGNKFQFNLLAREDATPEEYKVAKHMQDLHLSIIQSAGVPVKITEVEDKRHLYHSSDGLPAGHHGSSLECMHPFCVAEREQFAAPELEGTWGKFDIRRAFVDGAKWWEYHQSGGTMFQSDRNLAEEEAERRYKFTAEEKDLPEWYHMVKGFFREIKIYSLSMYENMNGNSIMQQVRYAAERDKKNSLD